MIKTHKTYVSAIIASLIVLSFAGGMVWAKTDAGEKKEGPAKKIGADIGISKDHPEIARGVTCVDCHEINLDAATTATEVWLRGDYLKYTAGEGGMPQKQLKDEINNIIGGRKQNKTFVLATCINNTPLSTTADFMLDPETMTIYGMHEKSTTKLFHIQQNERVSLNWHEDFKSWGKTLCMQFIGRAELLKGSDPEFERVLLECIPYEELAGAMNLELPQAREMVKKGMLMSKITVDRVTVNNSAFEKKGFRRYQQWLRKKR